MTLIIAEAGVNHNGDISLALKLVEAAVKAGADVVKFQTFQANELAAKTAPKASYQKEYTDKHESQLEMLKKLEISHEHHAILVECCDSNGIEFLSTAFDLPSIDLLSKVRLRRWKIPSGEITNLPYLRKIASKNQPTILSTGMASLGDIEVAIEALLEAGLEKTYLTVMHCTTEYPAPFSEVNLRAINTIALSFNVAVGYSDHTEGIAVPIAAVALGATVIEKHLTLDRTMPGPDHQASLEPDQFASMVRGIRSIEQAMGDGVKRPTLSELPNRLIARKSLVALKEINNGDAFTSDNVGAKRPGSGISPMHWDILLGRKATRNYLPDELIEW